MRTKRIFVAFDISADARAAAADHIDRLRREFTGCPASWVRPEKLHLTLRFLGDVVVADIAAVCGTVEEVAARSGKFVLRLAGTGVFPSPGKARVLWIGTGGDLGKVSLIKSQIDERFNAAGFEPERKRFTPHFTLARLKDPTACRPLISRHVESRIESLPFEVREIVVYESELLRSGSVYSAITKSKLLGESPTKNSC